MDWEVLRKQLDAAVRAVGATAVNEIAAKTAADVVEREGRLKLPETFRFFGMGDWYGYADARRFPDGVRPLTGVVKLVSAEGLEQESEVIIAAQEDKGGDATYKAVVQFTTYASDENPDATEHNERTYSATFSDISTALGALKLIQKSQPTATVGEIVETFGFEQIN